MRHDKQEMHHCNSNQNRGLLLDMCANGDGDGLLIPTSARKPLLAAPLISMFWLERSLALASICSINGVSLMMVCGSLRNTIITVILSLVLCLAKDIKQSVTFCGSSVDQKGREQGSD